MAEKQKRRKTEMTRYGALQRPMFLIILNKGTLNRYYSAGESVYWLGWSTWPYWRPGWTWRRTSSLWGWRSTGTGCPGRGFGPDDPQRALPTPNILCGSVCFCGRRHAFAPTERLAGMQQPGPFPMEEEPVEVTASCKSCSSLTAGMLPHGYPWVSLVSTSGWCRRFQDKMVPYTDISWVCGLEFFSMWSLPECWMVLSMPVLHSALLITLYLVELLWSNTPPWDGTHLFVIYVCPSL